MSTDQLRHELYDSFKNWTMLYYLIYDELRNELGAERAGAVMMRAMMPKLKLTVNEAKTRAQRGTRARSNRWDERDYRPCPCFHVSMMLALA